MNRPASLVLPLLLSPSLLAQSPAVLLPVLNAGFEAPAIAPGTFATAAPPPGWQGYGSLDFSFRTIGVLNPATSGLYVSAAPEGANVGVVFLLDSPVSQQLFSNQEAGLEQTLVVPLSVSTRYRLQVQVGNIAFVPTPPHNQFQFGGFPGYRVELRAGGTALRANVDAVLPAEGQFELVVVEFETGASHALAGQPLQIRLGNRNVAVGIEVNFDVVQLTAVDIAAWSDLGGGLAGAGGVPQLRGGGTLAAGSANEVELLSAMPSSIALLVYGASTIGVPLFGGVLVPAPDLILALPTDGVGQARLALPWPTGLPAGLASYFQAWVFDTGAVSGFAVSNAIVGTSS